MSTRPGTGCPTRCRPQWMGDPQTLFPVGGRALAVRGGKRGAVLSGGVEEGVEEEVPDAIPQGGRLDEVGRPDALGCARGVEA